MALNTMGQRTLAMTTGAPVPALAGAIVPEIAQMFALKLTPLTLVPVILTV